MTVREKKPKRGKQGEREGGAEGEREGEERRKPENHAVMDCTSLSHPFPRNANKSTFNP